MTPVTIIKRNLLGDELWRYTGRITRREGNAIHLEAPFNSEDAVFMGVTIRQGDLFLETWYTDRWYNIFEIHDRESEALKGWYCNVGKPVLQEADGVLSYVDLALDLWVSSDGTQTVLDEDEFARLDLDPETRLRALSALEELQAHFAR